VNIMCFRINLGC